MPQFNNFLTLLASSSLSLSAGCSSSNYIPPQAQNIVIEKTTSTDHQEVWNGLVKNLSTSGITVRALDNNNNRIKMMIKKTLPQHYVDCGSQWVMTDNTQTKTEINPILSSEYTKLEDEELLQVVRQTGLHAYINIQVIPEGPLTRVSVDVDYEVFGKSKIYDSNKRFRYSEKIDYRLSSHTPYKADNISCVSKGVIESKVLEAVL